MESRGPLHGDRMGEFARCVRGLADVVVCNLHNPDQRRTAAVYPTRYRPGTPSGQYGLRREGEGT